MTIIDKIDGVRIFGKIKIDGKICKFARQTIKPDRYGFRKIMIINNEGLATSCISIPKDLCNGRACYTGGKGWKWLRIYKRFKHIVTRRA